MSETYYKGYGIKYAFVNHDKYCEILQHVQQLIMYKQKFLNLSLTSKLDEIQLTLCM